MVAGIHFQVKLLGYSSNDKIIDDAFGWQRYM